MRRVSEELYLPVGHIAVTHILNVRAVGLTTVQYRRTKGRRVETPVPAPHTETRTARDNRDQVCASTARTKKSSAVILPAASVSV